MNTRNVRGDRTRERAWPSPHDGATSRMSHNASEKRRALKINQSIDALRELLEGNGVVFDKSKASVLEATLNFLHTTLEERKRLLASSRDSERGQLAQPSEAAGGGQASGGQGSGLDYHLAFSQACVPMAITSVDGRFLDCNHLYLHFSGFGRSELLQKSMFTLTHPEDMQRTFSAISELFASPPTSTRTINVRCTMHSGVFRITMSLSLVREQGGEPAFFICAVLQMVPEGHGLPQDTVRPGNNAQSTRAVASAMAAASAARKGAARAAAASREELEAAPALKRLRQGRSAAQGGGAASGGAGRGEFMLPASTTGGSVGPPGSVPFYPGFTGATPTEGDADAMGVDGPFPGSATGPFGPLPPSPSLPTPVRSPGSMSLGGDPSGGLSPGGFTGLRFGGNSAGAGGTGASGGGGGGGGASAYMLGTPNGTPIGAPYTSPGGWGHDPLASSAAAALLRARGQPGTARGWTSASYDEHSRRSSAAAAAAAAAASSAAAPPLGTPGGTGAADGKEGAFDGDNFSEGSQSSPKSS